MRSTIIAFVLSSSSVLFACGGASPAPPAPATSPTASAPGASPSTEEKSSGAQAAEADFDDLPKDKKVQIMISKVVPNIGKAFKEFDSKHYETFGCVTCHGTQKSDPQKVLPKLTLSKGGFEALAKSKPEVMKFMSEKVVPEMAAALGEKPYDPATKKGFGCAGCHSVD